MSSLNVSSIRGVPHGRGGAAVSRRIMKVGEMGRKRTPKQWFLFALLACLKMILLLCQGLAYLILSCQRLAC
jgi:hypothetical protein